MTCKKKFELRKGESNKICHYKTQFGAQIFVFLFAKKLKDFWIINVKHILQCDP